jgi:colanic acid biosynthesis glycosyl transferase WcaI
MITSQKLRILIQGINYHPEPIGIGKYTTEMAVWLATRGHHVDMIAALPHYPFGNAYETYRDKGFCLEVLNGVNVLRVPITVPATNRLGMYARIKLESSFSLNSLRHWLPALTGRTKYDVVIAICPPLQIAIWPWLFRLLHKVPWVFHIQDLQVDAAANLNLISRGWLTKTLYGIEKLFLRRATRITTITEAMRQRIISKGISGERVWLFPNWSDVAFIRPLPKTNYIRHQLGVTDDQIVFMYAGNMGEKQGLELVLLAADRLRDQPSIHFVLAGTGAAHDRLVAMASAMNLQNLSFLPVQPTESLPALLAAADVHLVIQRREAADIVMPSKLTNILAAGRPTVATADPGTTLHDVIVKYNTGLVTPPANLEMFIDAVTLLSGNPELRDEMGRQGRQYAERFLDMDCILNDFQASLITLAAGTC